MLGTVLIGPVEALQWPKAQKSLKFICMMETLEIFGINLKIKFHNISKKCKNI